MSENPAATAEDIATQAYSAWELCEYSEAARLFLNAAAAESEEASRRSKWATPDSTFLYRIRAAFCQWENGDFDTAAPTLREATTFDWKSARLWGDRHDAEKAFVYLLLQHAANGNRTAFKELWNEATVRGDELQHPFPTTVPLQKKLLIACINLPFAAGYKQIIANVNAKSLAKDHELQMLCAQASAM